METHATDADCEPSTAWMGQMRGYECMRVCREVGLSSHPTPYAIPYKPYTIPYALHA